MSTVLSHIVQKNLSHQYENTATEALVFMLRNKSAHKALMKLLRGIAPDLPSLHFRTQAGGTDGTCPDIEGFDGTTPRVFMENKFWAGLTDNQPVGYLKRLAKHAQPSVLLVVVPEARIETMWRELLRRIGEVKDKATNRNTAKSSIRSIATKKGPVLALTSWDTLLLEIEKELKDESAKNDLSQLRALCHAVNQPFVPMSKEQLTDQRSPALVLQLSAIVERAVKIACEKGILSIGSNKRSSLKPAHTWGQIGRYLVFPKPGRAGAWLGTVFTLWRSHGSTPLWLIFSGEGWGCASKVQAVLEPWADRRGVPTVWRNYDETLYMQDNDFEFDIGIMLPTGEEEETVIASVVNQLKDISKVLSKVGHK
jgi:hypothetical protein